MGLLDITSIYISDMFPVHYTSEAFYTIKIGISHIYTLSARFILCHVWIDSRESECEELFQPYGSSTRPLDPDPICDQFDVFQSRSVSGRKLD
jgi:hypothetical protein